MNQPQTQQKEQVDVTIRLSVWVDAGLSEKQIRKQVQKRVYQDFPPVQTHHNAPTTFPYKNPKRFNSIFRNGEPAELVQDE